jgi:hypothetical protein
MCFIDIPATETTQTTTHQFILIMYSGDVIINTGNKKQNRTDTNLTTAMTPSTLPFSPMHEDARTTYYYKANMLGYYPKPTEHLLVDMGTIGRDKKHVYQFHIHNPNPDAVIIAYPVFEQPGWLYTSKLNCITIALHGITNDTTGINGTEHYLVTAAKAKAAASMMNSNTTNTVLHLPDSFLLSRPPYVLVDHDTSKLKKRKVVGKHVMKNSFNIIDAIKVVDYTKVSIDSYHTATFNITVDNFPYLSRALYAKTDTCDGLTIWHFNDYPIYTPNGEVKMEVRFRTIAAGPATFNGKPIDVDDDNTDTTSNTTTTTAGTNTATKPIKYDTSVKPANDYIRLGFVWPNMINTAVSTINMTSLNAGSIMLSTVGIDSEQSDIVARLVATYQCAEMNEVYWLTNGALSTKTVSCVTVKFTHPHMDVVSACTLHKLAKYVTMDITDVKQCFTYTPAAVITDQQCVQQLPTKMLVDIGNVNKLKRYSVRAMKSSTGVMSKVSADELKAYNAVASSLERARTNGQLLITGTTHATTAVGVVKNTAVVQAELTVPSLRESGTLVITADLGVRNSTALLVHNPFNVPLWVTVAQLAEPTPNNNDGMFSVITRTDWHISSGIVLQPNTTKTVASVSFMPSMWRDNGVYSTDLYIRSNATLLEHIPVIGRVNILAA